MHVCCNVRTFSYSAYQHVSSSGDVAREYISDSGDRLSIVGLEQVGMFVIYDFLTYCCLSL